MYSFYITIVAVPSSEFLPFGLEGYRPMVEPVARKYG